ncbi:MAG: class I SAM-dependent methyltransferase [Actinomycetota bacterium]
MSEAPTPSDGILNAHERIASLVPAGSRVLDIGCGFGAIARSLAARGCKVTGIEPDPERRAAAAPACERVLDGVAERLGELDLEPESFDVIIFADVLEHLVNPWATLAGVVKFLAPDGLLLISLPNVANFGARVNLLKCEFTYQDGGLYDRTHLRFFTRATAEEMVRGAGLQVVERHYTSNLHETGALRRLSALAPPLRAGFRKMDRRLTYRKPELYALQFILACKKNAAPSSGKS